MDEEAQFQEFITQDSLKLGSPKPVVHTKDSIMSDSTKVMNGMESQADEDDLFIFSSQDNPLSFSEEDDQVSSEEK